MSDTHSLASELVKLAGLRVDGFLTETEFTDAKRYYICQAISVTQAEVPVIPEAPEGQVNYDPQAHFSDVGAVAVGEMKDFLGKHFPDFAVNPCAGNRWYSIKSRNRQLLILESHEHRHGQGMCIPGLLTYPDTQTDIHRDKLAWTDKFDDDRMKYDFRGKSYGDVYNIFNHFVTQ